jgi:hypothetical protein
MVTMNDIVTTPLFFLFIAFSFLLTFGYFWGRRRNRGIFLSVFNALVEVAKPVDQKFTTIGGVVGYHANLYLKKDSPVSQIDATITLLPRHSWLYLPISMIIMKYDRLFVTLYIKPKMPGEGHIIEKAYAGFRGPKIKNADRLQKETIRWNTVEFFLYYETMKVRDYLTRFIDENPDPGIIRHIALVPDQRKCFVFMIPRRDQVGKYFAPIPRWISLLVKK